MGGYAVTKKALRTATEALRRKAEPDLRVAKVFPGFVDTDFAGPMGDPAVRATIETRKKAFATARAVALAIEQVADVEIGSIVERPTA